MNFGYLQPQLDDQGIDLGDVFLTGLFVAAALKSPEAVSFRALRFSAPEHIKRLHVPVIECVLQTFSALVTLGHQLRRLTATVADVADLFLENHRQYLSQWLI